MNKFEKGSGKYNCECCGKTTRETGYGESDVYLCAFCYQEGIIYNTLSDGDISEEEYSKQIKMLEKKYKR